MVQIRTFKIFTAGKMGGLSYDEQMKWRKELENIIRSRCDKSLTFVHPPVFYQYGDEINEREARTWEINQLKDSDIVVVDLTTIADTEIKVNDRICQFRIMKKQPELEFIEVDHLDGADRGGFGSTGAN